MADAFVGRQPIFDRSLNVFGYELLFRGAGGNRADFADGNQATSQVMVNTFLDIGLNTLVGNATAFINLTESFIRGDSPLPFPPRRVVLEVLEDVAPSEEVIAALERLSQEGYALALDDYDFREELAPLLERVDYIKVDLMALGGRNLKASVAGLRRTRPRIKLLAEKIETRAEFEHCRAIGFDYFQGFFLSRPTVVAGKAVAANRLTLIQLLARLQDPNTDMREAERLLAQDLPLVHRLLRYINSAHFSLANKVDSIKRAVTLLGFRTIRNWASLILLSRLSDKPPELLKSTLIRARMCELLAEQAGAGDRDQYFLVGLLSALDAMLDRPMDELLASLPLVEPVKAALLRREGELGNTLQWVLDFETAAWERLIDAPFSAEQFSAAYLEALRWSATTGALTDGEADAESGR